MITAILLALDSSLVINLLLFLIAFRLRSDKLTDISYATSFLMIDIVGLLAAKDANAYSWLLFLLAAIWALRIGGFLLLRVLKVGKDQRFDDIRGSFIRYGKFWLAQAVTAWVLMLPVVMANYRGGTIRGVVYAGLVVWLVGLAIEALADYQKYAFKRDPKNRGQWIENGLWHNARHPNYFGEILVWIGIYLAAFPALDAAERLISLLSPILITVVLLFISGVPILEKSADEQWGAQEDYQLYKRRTRLLIPLPKLK